MRILDAAETIVAEVGVEALHMDAVARRSHTARGSLYQFFPHKEAVLEALALRYADELSAVHAAMLPNGTAATSAGDGAARAGEEPDAALAATVARVTRALAEFHDRRPAFHRIFATDASASPAVAAHMLVVKRRLVARIVALFEPFAPDVAPAERARHAAVMIAIGQSVLMLRDASAPEERDFLLADLRRALVAYVRALSDVRAKAGRTTTHSQASS